MGDSNRDTQNIMSLLKRNTKRPPYSAGDMMANQGRLSEGGLTWKNMAENYRGNKFI